MTKPTISVGVGLTVSPRPYESIRVDLEIKDVDEDNVEEALLEAQPLVDRVFTVLRERALEEVEAMRTEFPEGAPQAPRRRRSSNKNAVLGEEVKGPKPPEARPTPPAVGSQGSLG